MDTRTLLSTWLLALLLGGVLAAQVEPLAPFHHDAWDRVLQQYVGEDGLVDYRELKAHPDDLETYVDAIARESPDNAPARFPTDAHRLAYWINAYNALIVKRVVDHYPVDSIRDLGGLFSSVFGKTQLVGGRSLSHDDIEHEIIRTRFREPRIHFVLNCASRSCAPLPRHALTAGTLETALEEAAVRFLNDPRHVRIHPENGVVELSKYFDWFTEDFQHGPRGQHSAGTPVLDFVKAYLAGDKRTLLATRETWKLRYLSYDWSLNDRDQRD